MQRKTEGTKWLGRRRKGEQDTHSFKAFVAKAKTTAVGKAHLERNHGGHGL